MKRFVCLWMALIWGVLLCGCGQEVSGTVYSMDTVMQLQVWGRESDLALESLKDIIEEQDRKWSATEADSFLSCGNSDEELLEQVQAFHIRTDGAFDHRLGGAVEAWGFFGKQYRVPSEEELTAAIARKQWDLGGAVKGYTGDLCVQMLSSLNVDRAILNLGGNIQTYGDKPNGEPWIIGIQDPEGGDPVGNIAVCGTVAVVTSGDYQRYFEVDGKRYHHILDPETGMPVDNGLRSVTVISRSGLTADILSTALFVMGLERATSFWQQSDDFEAVFIMEDGKVYATQGAALSGCEFEVIDREN